MDKFPTQLPVGMSESHHITEAILRDLGRVAEEMGTSVQMLHRHYHNPRAEDEGAAWFEGFTLGDRWEAAA